MGGVVMTGANEGLLRDGQRGEDLSIHLGERRSGSI